MNKLPRLGTLVVFGGLVGACAQIIGLNKFDEDEQASAGESGDSGKGGQATGGKATGGSGGSNVAGSGGNSTGGMGGANGGNSTGGRGGSTGGDAGMAGAEGGTGALGGGGGQGGTGGSGGSAGTAGTGGVSGSGGSGGSSGELGCSDTIEITTTGDWTVSYDDDPPLTSYSFNLSPQLTPCSGCSGPLPDYLWIDFYTDGEYTGEDTGDFMLGVGEEENYASCSRCVWLGVEFGTTSGGSAAYYFSTGGGMVVNAASDHINGNPIVSLSDVTLEEVTVDFTSGLSTPVNGGRCLHLVSATLNSPVVVVPPEWTCDDADYTDIYCDCGCGALDPACASSAIAACEYCPTTGCAADTTCHEVDLVDNTKCTGPQAWTCYPINYGDGSYCDCGCGIVDPDCPSADAADCDFCDDVDACTDGAASPCTLISATDNSQCQ